MPKGRKADRVWDMGDTKQIQLPKVNNPDQAVNGFECLNCGLKARTRDLRRIVAHHTCVKALCQSVGISTPCNESDSTPVKIETYKQILKSKVDQGQMKANVSQELEGVRAEDEKERAERTSSAQKKQGRIRMKTIDEDEVHNAVFDFFIAEDIPFTKGTTSTH